MKLFRLTLPAAAMIAMAPAAHAATVGENIAVTISGSSTTDTLGYFGPAGANLSGQTGSIHLQYISDYLPSHKACRINPTTCNSYYNQQGANLSGSVLISITVNGHTLNYSPTVLGYLTLKSTNGIDQFDISTDGSSGLGEGIRGAELSLQLTSAATFGGPLSPNDPPLLNTSTAYDYISFYNQSSGTAAEQLTFYVTQASQ